MGGICLITEYPFQVLETALCQQLFRPNKWIDFILKLEVITFSLQSSFVGREIT